MYVRGVGGCGVAGADPSSPTQVFEQERYRALHFGFRRPWDGRGGKNYERWKRKERNRTQWAGFQEYDEPYVAYGGAEPTYAERCVLPAPHGPAPTPGPHSRHSSFTLGPCHMAQQENGDGEVDCGDQGREQGHRQRL